MGIYLDHNAGSPLRSSARASLSRFAELEAEMNPASVHRAGQAARRALEHAREQVAVLVDCAPRQIVFTSGGTESNNLAIFGSVKALRSRRKAISTAIEHSSVLAPLSDLESRGIEVFRIEPDREGRIAPQKIIAAIDSDTALVTLALANAEVGTVQDASGIAQACASAGAALHLDAAQAAGRVVLDVAALGCDLMTLSGHKFGAPAGIGALYVRDPSLLAPVMLGGPQESAMRAGTPNLLGAIAMGAAAAETVDRFAEENARVSALADELARYLFDAIPGLRMNGPMQGRIANTLNLTFPGVLGESLLIALDLEGVQVSMGSACAAGAVEPSHVLLAIGRSAEEARSSLRLSLGWSTSAADIARAAEIIPRVWRRVAEAEPASGSLGATR